MRPIPVGALWAPVDQLDQVDVVLRPAAGGMRVELVDRRSWLELVSLSPGEAAALGAVLGERARRCGWRDS